MRRIAWAAALAVAVVVGAPATVGGQEAATITKVGWWSRNPAAQAPEGGFHVSASPDGSAISVAAIEVRAATALQSAIIILDEEAQILGDQAALQVCATPNEWKAGGGQPIDEAPKPECAGGAIALRRNAASATWGADVTPLMAGIEDEGSVSLMIVPSTATTPAAYEVRFKKPTLQATAAESSTSDDDTTTFPSSAGGSTSDFGNSGISSPTFAPSVPDTTASVAPVAPTTADGAAGASPVTVASDTAPATGELASLPTQASAAVAAGEGNAALQALFFVFVATIAGVGGGFARWFVRRRNPDASFV